MLALRRDGGVRLFDVRSDEAVRSLGLRRMRRLQVQKSSCAMTLKSRGRKPRLESRAEEFRQRLNAWKRMPESSRSSLRALARELGTTHQLLGHYLKGWDKWQGKEYQRRANEIRARSEAEDRTMTQWEEAQAAACNRAALNSMIASAVDSALDNMVRRVKAADSLSKGETRIIKLLAQKGFPTAHKILEVLFRKQGVETKNNLPLAHAGAAKSFRRK